MNGYLPQDVTHHLMETYGIPRVSIRPGADSEEAVKLGQKFGFPIALKVAAGNISHKSDIGGVLLNLDGDDAVAEGYDSVIRNAYQARPDADILGVNVQPMLINGQDVIVGAVQDPQFGALVMFGSGGVEVEGLKDIAFALAPITREEANHLLESTWAGRKLRGYRNIPPADRDSVIDTLLRLAQLAADIPELAEIEINPLRGAGRGPGRLGAGCTRQPEAFLKSVAYLVYER